MLRAIAVIALAGLVFPAPALSEISRLTALPVAVEGNVEVQFHGEPQAGCLAQCGLSGSIIWSPERSAQLYLYEEKKDGKRTLEGSLLFFGGLDEPGSRTTALVVRSGSAGVCSDVRGELASSLDFSAGERSRLQAQLVAGGFTGPALFATRCGGPLDRDLAAALPTRPLELPVLLHGGATIDLSGERSFIATGFAGTVTSSLRLKLGAPQAPFAPLSRPKLKGLDTSLPRSLTATYRIERLAGTVSTSFSGASERPLCMPLDACSTSGQVRVTAQASSGTARFSALANSKRTSRRQLRAALGLGPGRRARGITIAADAAWRKGTGSVVESFTVGGRPSCSDSVPLERGRLTFTFGRRRVFVSYGRPGLFEDGALRTRCPGPSLSDVALDHPLATGAIALRAFRKRRVTIRLASHRTFESEPYTGETRAALTLVLRRLQVGRTSSGEGGILVIR